MGHYSNVPIGETHPPIGFCESEGRLEQIKVGSFYEIDHSKLSSSTPEQLRAIRIVMVFYQIHTNPYLSSIKFLA